MPRLVVDIRSGVGCRALGVKTWDRFYTHLLQALSNLFALRFLTPRPMPDTRRPTGSIPEGYSIRIRSLSRSHLPSPTASLPEYS